MSRWLLREVRTIHADDMWINLLDDGSMISAHLEKPQAVHTGREAAERLRASHVIHNEDGTVAERNEYGEPA